MPAMPIAESSAPIVVGMSVTSSAINTVIDTGLSAYSAIGEAVRSDRFACFRQQPDPGGVWLQQYGSYNYQNVRPAAEAGDCDGVEGATEATDAEEPAGGGLGSGVLVAGGVWLVLFSSVLAVQDTEVRGTEVLSAAEVADVAAAPHGVPLATADLAAVQARVEDLAPVESAEVSRAWPHTVRVDVTERTAVAVVRAGAGRTNRFGGCPVPALGWGSWRSSSTPCTRPARPMATSSSSTTSR